MEFLHHDHLGSVSLITDEDGNVLENTWYSPFGEIIQGGKNSRFDYTGKEFDSVTQDYDFMARRYNPNWARFTQPDSLIENKYNPQALNKYSYVGNNPYKFIDPTGKKKKTSVTTKPVYRVVVDDSSGYTVYRREIVYYDVTYKTSSGGGGGSTVRITKNAYQALQSQAYQQSQTAYSRYLSLGRNMQQEYFVSYLESLQGRYYDPRSPLQRAAQNKWFQLGAIIAGGIAGNVPGAAGVAGVFGLGDLEEKKALGRDIELIDYGEVGSDMAVAGAGGKIIKGTAYSVTKAAGIGAAEHIIIDVASEVGADVIYESTKQYLVEGDGQ